MRKVLKLIIKFLFCSFFLIQTACHSDHSQQTTFQEIKTYGEKETLSLALSKKTITTAETVTLLLTLRAAEDVAITPPDLSNALGGMTLQSRNESTPRLKDGFVTIEITYELQPFLAGEYTIPELTAKFSTSDRTELVKSDPIQITATSLLTPQDTELKDIFGFKDSSNFSYYWFLLIILFLLLFVLLLLYKKHHKKESAIPLPTPKEVALTALDNLKKEELITKGEHKLFYIKLSFILRTFIEDNFGLSLPGKTTEEFLTELQKNPLLKDTERALLQEFLKQSDLVKFAKHIPPCDSADKALTLCYDFVMNTSNVTELSEGVE
ncbi:MAG: BatD family protein [Bdellovibrionota bacterium]|jgi:hypothetical protein